MTGNLAALATIDQPYISAGGVRTTLDAIAAGELEKIPQGMLLLHAIDIHLIDVQIPNSDRTRAFALSTVLVDGISERYHQLRLSLTGEDITPPDTREAMLARLAEDSGLEHSGLDEWSVLLALYALGDSNVTLDVLAKTLSTTSRNLRRYRQRAISRLTDWLIEIETHAIERVRNLRLLASLPAFHTELVGREHELRVLNEAYKHHTGGLILIAGPHGIGKSHLVSRFLRDQIERTSPRHIFWLHHASSTAQVVNFMLDRTVRDFSSISLQDYTSVHRTIVVLDDVGLNEHDVVLLHEQLPFVAFFVLYPMNPSGMLKGRCDCYIELKGLAESEVSGMIEQVKVIDGVVENNLDPGHVFIPANPAGVKIGLRTDGLKHQGDGFESIVAGCALHPEGGLPLAEPILRNMSLLSSGVRDIASDTVRLQVSTTTRDRLITQWHAGKDTHLLERQIKAICSADNEIYTSQTRLDIAEVMLLEFRDVITASQRIHILLACCQLAVRYRRVNLWLSFLQRDLAEEVTLSPVDHTHLLIAEGNLLELTATRLQAAECFMEAVQMAGTEGNFVLQQEALLALATHLRRSGKYTQALSIIERILSHPLSDASYRSAIIELLKIYADTKQWEKFDEVFPGDFDTQELRAIKCEALYARQQFEAGLGEALTLFEEAQQALESPIPQAYTTAICAKGYMHMGQYDIALDMFQQLLLSEVSAVDQFILYRVVSLLGAHMINMNDLDEAYQLLQRASNFQSMMGDIVGLTATQHNLQLVMRKRRPDDKS